MLRFLAFDMDTIMCRCNVEVNQYSDLFKGYSILFTLVAVQMTPKGVKMSEKSLGIEQFKSNQQWHRREMRFFMFMVIKKYIY
jgi:hypothetical protein